MNSDPKLDEINREIDRMSLEELLYLRMSPQTYISKKFETEIKDSENLITEIETNNQNAKQSYRIALPLTLYPGFAPAKNGPFKGRFTINFLGAASLAAAKSASSSSHGRSNCCKSWNFFLIKPLFWRSGNMGSK